MAFDKLLYTARKVVSGSRPPDSHALKSHRPFHTEFPFLNNKMHFPTLFAVFASACAASLGDRTACDPYPSNAELAASRTALVKAKLVPDTAAQFRTSGSDVNLIPTFNPTVLVDVAYGTEAASFGNALSTLETLSEPSISFSAEKGYGK